MSKLNIIIQDDGTGPFISKWNCSHPHPTEPQLMEWDKEAYISNAVSGIDNIASSKILKIAPDYMQLNMLARSAEFLEKMQEGGVLTEQEEAERLAIKDVWNRIKAIRSHAQYLKSEVEAGKEPYINAGWSE